MPNYELNRFDSADSLARSAAECWLRELAARTNVDPRYCVALPGGRIAKEFFGAVAEQAESLPVLFAEVHFFWGDERCVPPTDGESNFLLAKTHLLDPLRIQPDRIHRIRGEIAPERAAAEAEAEICRIAQMNAAGQPMVDVIFLGMGEDGHVASLFPGVPEEVFRSEAVYLPVVASKPPPKRITVSFATISAARQVWVLASGTGKENALRESLSPDGKTPLARVLRMRDKTRILTDVIEQASPSATIGK